MASCLGKSCSFVLPRVLLVNCCQFVYLVISLLRFEGSMVQQQTFKNKSRNRSLNIEMTLHLETYFVNTISWNDVPLLFKCSP